MVDDIVEQVAFVADDQHRRAQRAQVRFQPQRRFEIEMVRRLVEQHHIGFGEQQRRQRDAHPPAARERRQRPVLHGLVEAQPGEDARCLGRGAIGIDGDQAVVDLRQPRFRAGPGLLGQQRVALGIGRQHRLERRRRARRCFLRHRADAGRFRHGDAALVGVDLAEDDLHQRRLARPVASDQPDPRPRRDGDRGAVEDRPAAKADGNAVDAEHDGAGL